MNRVYKEGYFLRLGKRERQFNGELLSFFQVPEVKFAMVNKGSSKKVPPSFMPKHALTSL